MEQLSITHVDKFKGFLVIYGHKKPELLQHLQALIDAFKPNHASCEQSMSHIEFDTMYLAYNSKLRKYHRCFVIEKRPNNKVVIDLMDYGTEYEVAAECLLELDTTNRKTAVLQQTPPIATKYFLAGFFCAWKSGELVIIKNLLTPPINLMITNEQMDGDAHFISLNFGITDLAAKFFEREIGMDISFTEQRIEVRKITNRNYDAYLKSSERSTPTKRDYHSSRNLVPNRPLQMAGNNNPMISNTNKRMIQSLLAPNYPRDMTEGTSRSTASSTQSTQMRTFVASELVGGQFHVVYVSYVHDGPRMFYVRLKSQEHHLDRMTTEMSNANLSPLSNKLNIGMACIARSEGKYLHRAVIQQIYSNRCHVTFVDFGHSETVPSTNLFEIQDNFLKHKTFAVPFQLAKCNEIDPTDDRMKEYFDKVVSDKELELKVVATGNPQLQQCELFDDNKSVLELLLQKQKQLSTFPKPVQLNNDELVIIRYATSAKQLYVARLQDEKTLDEMMDPLANHCINVAQFKTLPTNGECCAALHDGEWYRAIVERQAEPHRVHVRLVDYGFEVDCTLANLRPLKSQFLTNPRQAIECCFIDFDDVPDSRVPESTAKQIDMAADTNGQRTQFRTILHDRLANGVYVIDLRDEVKKVNLASSVWRLSMPRKPYDKKTAHKSRDDLDKSPKATSNSSRLSISSTSDQSDNSQVRGCDGADNQERFVEARSSKERIPAKNHSDAPKRKFNNKPLEASNRPKDAHISNASRSNKRHMKRLSQSSVGKRLIGFDGNDKSGEFNDNSLEISDDRKVAAPSEELAGFNAQLPEQSIPLGSSTHVIIPHWVSPFDFYVTLKSLEVPLADMVRQMQRFYENRKPVQSKPSIGALIIMWHQTDGTFKRGQIVEYSLPRDKYKVYLIDFGGGAICTLTEIFELEKTFIHLSPFAIRCTFDNVVLNQSLKEAQEALSSYINAKCAVSAEFLRTTSGRTVVSLTVNKNSLKDLMIRDKILTEITKDIRMERLIGQTIIAHIMSISSLQCFQARFYGCDITFKCTFQNVGLVKKYPQLNDQFQAYNNQYINVTIESINADNVFGVSIHLSFLHSNANDSDLLEYPIYTDTFECEISSVISAHELYVQNRKYEQLIRKHIDDLYTSIQSGAFCMEPLLGNVYAIQSDDGNFYRGRILSKIDDNKALVHWVDYGNSETVALAQIKALEEPHKRPVSALAHRIFVPMEFISNGDIAVQEQALFSFIGDATVTVNIVEMYGGHFICDLLVNGSSIIESMAQQKIINKMSHDELKQLIDVGDQELTLQPTSSPVAESAPILETGHIEPDVEIEKTLTNDSPSAIVKESLASILPNRDVGYISHCDNPNRFYMQLLSETDAITEFQGMLQIVAPSLPILTDKRKGQLCIVKFSIDDRWYRAKIIDSSAEMTSIQFIDYGNTDTVTNEAYLKASDESLAKQKPYAMECSMPVQPANSSSDWHEDACNTMNRLLDAPLTFEVISKDGEFHYIKLYAGGRDIMQELVFGEWAEPCEIVKSDMCYVSHSNGLNDFNIQLATDTKALELIEMHLSDVNKYDIVRSPQNGLICCALFNDGKFYRARIIDDTPAEQGHTVEFIDYGNECCAKEIRTLDADIAKIPQLRKRCSLKIPDDIEMWSDAAERHFTQMAADGQTEFNVRMVKPGKSACVELFFGDENVSHVLAPFCGRIQKLLEVIDEHEDEQNLSQQSINYMPLPDGKQTCAVSHVNAANDFYVQLETNFDELEVMSANLSGAMDLERHAIDMLPLYAIVGAYFPLDDCYYRAKVLENCGEDGARVQFIDFGNECVTKDLRKIVDIVRSKASLALQCKLADGILADDETNMFGEYMKTAIDTTFQIEIVNKETTPVTVMLYIDDVPINDAIIQWNANIDNNNDASAKPSVAEQIIGNIIAEVVAKNSS